MFAWLIRYDNLLKSVETLTQLNYDNTSAKLTLQIIATFYFHYTI